MIASIAGLAGGLLAVLGITLAVALILFIFLFWIFMLVSAIQNKGLTDGEKTGWVLAIVFFHIIGSLLYLFIGYPKRNTPLPPAMPIARA